MSRYIDRLPQGALVQFLSFSKPKAVRAHSLDGAENALIELAKRLPAMDPTARLDLICRSFGEAEAPEAMAVIEAIQADLDRDAEVAGEPVPDEAPKANFRFYCVEVTNASQAQVDQIAGLVAGILADRG